MVSLLLRLLARLRPPEGWVPFVLVLTVVLCLPASLIAARSGGGGPVLVSVGLLAMALALRLARSLARSRTAATVGSLLGLLLAVAIVGRLLPPLGLMWRAALGSLAWLRDLPGSLADRPNPLAELGSHLDQQLGLLATRLSWWGEGAQAADPILGELVVVLLAWGCTFFAVWQIYRRHRPVLGLVPAGGVLAVVAFFVGGVTLFYFFTLVFCGLWLAAVTRLWIERARWDRLGSDYPDALGSEMTFALTPWLVGLFVLAAVFPVIHLYAARDAFWRRMDEPWRRLEAAAERYVGPLDTGKSLLPVARRGAGGSGGGLPQAHLLGSGPELREIVVLRVRTNDPPPPVPEPDESEEVTRPAGEGQDDLLSPSQGVAAYPRRYWRRSTFDTYTGQGWINESLETQEMRANAPLDGEALPGDEVLQQFEMVAPPGPWIYGLNAPLRLDQPAQAWRREDGETAQITGSAAGYRVLSRAPQPAVAELQASPAATTTLPAEIARLYLALPDTVPAPVVALARQVAGEGPGRYDRARRIEAYLRRYPYSLDLPEPPADRDLVDWFLFDLQTGYCDYYASAMVVMARAAGVPARLATGFAQGAYDDETGWWVVTEEDSHTWVEVYFDGIGWIEFEPTASQAVLARPGGETLPPPEVPPLPPPPPRWWQGVPWGLVAMAAAGLLLLAALAWTWWPRPEPTPAAVVRDRYARLQQWGARLGHRYRDGQTVAEYAGSLAGSLRRRGSGSRVPQVQAAAGEAPAAVERLAAALSEAQYAPGPLPERRGWQARETWQRLRPWLLWLWLLGREKARPDD